MTKLNNNARRTKIEKLQEENNQRFTDLQNKIKRPVNVDVVAMRQSSLLNQVIDALMEKGILDEDFNSEDVTELAFQKFFSKHLDDWSEEIERRVAEAEKEQAFVKPQPATLWTPGDPR